MSGGHFNYIQYRFVEVADQLEKIIEEQEDYGLDKEAVAHMQMGIKLLLAAGIYLQRIDWLVSGDDGLESFKERLMEDLFALPFDFRIIKEDFKE